MTRSLAIVFAVFVAAAAAYVVVRGRPHGAAAPEPHPAPVASVSAAAPPAPEPATAAPAGGGGAGPGLPQGEETAPLASGAPRQVVFGVALVWYRGAESAPSNARSKDEARALAESIAEEAKKDFGAAVKRADTGFDDAGAIQRTVLEPAAEAVLFSLEAGAVGGPVDSPRGFYVFRRIE
ncbi:MAG: peptidyl-prolyl cis-trans isomerase [Myxococcales bacterium]|nr:peptidyl-prolyl cis-trans isomerase [Myxococcales bacterium]